MRDGLGTLAPYVPAIVLRYCLTGLLSLLTVVTVWAADHPTAGARLLLRDPTVSGRRRVVFRTTAGATASPASGADPRLVGATLLIGGGQPGDGSSGVIALDAAGWVGLGSPAGSRGYRFRDRTRAHGIDKVSFKAVRGGGGALSLSGGGDGWLYAITRPQGPVDVRLAIGDDVHCARFETLSINKVGEVRAQLAPPPAACVPLGCGDGTVTDPEACDDGGRIAGDGCSPTCELENATALCAGIPGAAGTAVRAVPVATGLDLPVYVTSPPLDPYRLFIVEQTGLIRIVDHGVLQPTPFLDLSSEILCCDAEGVLGMTFHPDYRSNGLFFVNFTNHDGNTEVRRYQVSADPNVADPMSGTQIIVMPIDSSSPSHNGGLVAFGPDGYLYVSMGDGYFAPWIGADVYQRGQDLGVLQGKLLRLDVDAPTYVVPPSNPFVANAAARPEIWAFGLRNTFRFSFDRATGDLYLADVGEEMREEVDVQPAASPGGENYGWSIFEGTNCFRPPCPDPPTGFTFPVVEYDHNRSEVDGECAVIGGFVYRGCRLPDLRGTYLYADLCAGFVRSFRWAAGALSDQQDRSTDLNPAASSIVSFGEDARGEMYIVHSDAGVVDRIEPAD